jgi:hypothetical protein
MLDMKNIFNLWKTLWKSLSQIHFVNLSRVTLILKGQLQPTFTYFHVEHSLCDVSCVLPCSRPRATYMTSSYSSIRIVAGCGLPDLINYQLQIINLLEAICPDLTLLPESGCMKWKVNQDAYLCAWSCAWGLRLDWLLIYFLRLVCFMALQEQLLDLCIEQPKGHWALLEDEERELPINCHGSIRQLGEKIARKAISPLTKNV